MKIEKIIPILVLVSFLAPAGLILAQGAHVPWTTGATQIPEVALIPTLKKIGDLIFSIMIALAAVFIIWASLIFVTAAGSPERVESAKHIITYAVIGVAVAFLAKGIVMFIVTYIK